jgi:hypothetical protein
MKKGYHATGMLLMVLFSSGCNLLTGDDGDVELQLGLADGFERDWVIVEIAADTVIADTLISPEFDGACCFTAAAANISLRPTHYMVRVTINDRVSRTLLFDARKTRAIWISFDREEDGIEIDTYSEWQIFEG